MELRATIPSQAREWRNHPDVWKWCRQYSLISQSSHEKWLSKIESDPTIKMFGIWDEGLPRGVCGFTSIDKHNQSAEFSLYIGPEYQRLGYGFRALCLLLCHGFQDHNFNRIWGETFDRNPAIRMFRNMGMKEEGRLQQAYFREGKFIDSLIFSIVRSQWSLKSCPPFSATVSAA